MYIVTYSTGPLNLDFHDKMAIFSFSKGHYDLDANKIPHDNSEHLCVIYAKLNLFVFQDRIILYASCPFDRHYSKLHATGILTTI